MLNFGQCDRFLCSLLHPRWNPMSFWWAMTWSQLLLRWLHGLRDLSRNQCTHLNCNTAIHLRWLQSKGDGVLVLRWFKCSHFSIICNLWSCIFVFLMVLCICFIHLQMDNQIKTLPQCLGRIYTHLWSTLRCIQNSRMLKSSRLTIVKLSLNFGFVESCKRFLLCQLK